MTEKGGPSAMTSSTTIATLPEKALRGLRCVIDIDLDERKERLWIRLTPDDY